MSIETNKIEEHWNYLLSIENDVEELSRFIGFHEDNFKCFSLEIARLLMASAAEVDVVCKQICKQLNPNSKAGSIGKYREEILPAYNGLPTFKVVMPRYGLTLVPWQNWAKQEDNVPFWWTANNKIKHHRHTHFKRGNLKNSLNAVAGLFVMVLYLYRDKANLGELLPPLKLFQVSEEHFNGTTFGNYEFGINYNI